MNSYLYWPVTLNGKEGFHVTCKFLGTKETDIQTIRHLLSPIEDLGITFTHFTLEEFNPKTQVIELHGVPARIHRIRDHLSSLRIEDYPNYRVHVTVPKELWLEYSKGHHVGPIKIGDLHFKTVDGERIRVR